MKYYKLFLWNFWGFFLLYETVYANSHQELLDSKQINLYHGHESFTCPFPFGVYSDPEDCAYYYVCNFHGAQRVKCVMNMHFDILRRTCLPSFMVLCKNKKVTTESTTSTKRSTIITTPKDDDSVCPSMFGSFPHRNDCSKYYKCLMYKRISKSCPEKQFFDAIKKECKPKEEVNCGDRRKPGDHTTTSIPNETSTQSQSTTTVSVTTTQRITETAPETTTVSVTPETTTESITPETTTESITSETTTESITPETTTESITPETTTESITPETTTDSVTPETTTVSITPETTTEIITPETTTEIITSETTSESITDETTADITTDVTTSNRPTGPPEHNCDEDDLDCIITETGVVDDWFICPRDVGSYPHQSSDKLFIFCMNWIPSVKKCGLEREFSKELSTCIKTQ